jgi:hypothetical protein
MDEQQELRRRRLAIRLWLKGVAPKRILEKVQRSRVWLRTYLKTCSGSKMQAHFKSWPFLKVALAAIIWVIVGTFAHPQIA